MSAITIRGNAKQTARQAEAMVKDYFKILFKETTVFVCIVIEIGFTMWLTVSPEYSTMGTCTDVTDLPERHRRQRLHGHDGLQGHKRHELLRDP